MDILKHLATKLFRVLDSRNTALNFLILVKMKKLTYIKHMKESVAEFNFIIRLKFHLIIKFETKTLKCSTKKG